MDPQHFGFLDPDPQKFPDPQIRIKGAKYQPNPKMLLSKHKSKLFTKKRSTKISKFLNGSQSFDKKIKQKKKKMF